MKNLLKYGAVVAGATVGAAVGALITTERGKNIQNRISDQLKSGIKTFTDSKGNFKEFVTELASSKAGSFDSKLTSMIDKAADKTEEIISILEQKLSEVKVNKEHRTVSEKIDPKDDPVYKAAYETKVDL